MCKLYVPIYVHMDSVRSFLASDKMLHVQLQSNILDFL